MSYRFPSFGVHIDVYVHVYIYTYIGAVVFGKRASLSNEKPSDANAMPILYMSAKTKKPRMA